MKTAIRRCDWATSDLAIVYHDREWGVPVHDDPRLFEFLTLEGAQAGLSWEIILRKRARYREVFASFEPAAVAGFSRVRLEKLQNDPGIVRNRAKIASTVDNANAVLRVADEWGSFAAYLWDFVGGKPIRGRWRRSSQIPAATPLSERLSRDLRRRGFRFVGSTICYAFMQAVGLVDDHVMTCFKRRT